MSNYELFIASQVIGEMNNMSFKMMETINKINYKMTIEQSKNLKSLKAAFTALACLRDWNIKHNDKHNTLRLLINGLDEIETRYANARYTIYNMLTRIQKRIDTLEQKEVAE